MPYVNEHAARVMNPDMFVQSSFRRKTIAPGVDIIVGKLQSAPNGGMKTQTYRFDAERFTADKAREWLQSNGVKYMSFEKATGKMQSFVSLMMPIQAFSSDEILSLIPADALAEIKKTNSSPFFQAYSICHEGTSSPKIIGDTAKPIHWTRQAVQSIKNTVLKGVKFFAGHNADNSINQRPALGEIVADTQKEIDGVLHHIVIGYFPDKEKVADCDVCSQEGNWNFFEAAGQWFADTLDRITGIALSNSERDVPAFSGAKRLGALQAFEEITKKKMKGRVRAMGDIMDLTTLSFDELKREIQRRGTHPSELFSEDSIKGDRTFGKIFETNKTLTETITAKDAELKKIKDEKDTASKVAANATVKTRLEKLIIDTAMTDKMRTFVKGAIPETFADSSDDSLKGFITAKLADYQAVTKSLGIKEELPVQNATQIKTGETSNVEDMTKASNNPLLDADLITE